MSPWPQAECGISQSPAPRSGRIGLRGRWTIVGDGGQVWQPYVRANLWRDWGARATATYSGVDLVSLLEQTNRLQLGGGLSVRMNANVSFYANADYQLAVGDRPPRRAEPPVSKEPVMFMSMAALAIALQGMPALARLVNFCAKRQSCSTPEARRMISLISEA